MIHFIPLAISVCCLVTRAPLCPANLLSHIWSPGHRETRRDPLPVFINLFIIQFKWNATAEAGTITSRGWEDNERNENKMDFFLFFIELFVFYFNSQSMMRNVMVVLVSSFPYYSCHQEQCPASVPHIFRHNVNIRKRVLGKYLFWHQSLCFSWQRDSSRSFDRNIVKFWSAYCLQKRSCSEPKKLMSLSACRMTPRTHLSHTMHVLWKL